MRFSDVCVFFVSVTAILHIFVFCFYLFGDFVKISNLDIDKKKKLFSILEDEKGKGNNFAVEYYKLCEEKGETIANEYLERLYDTFMNIVDCFYQGDKLEDGKSKEPNKSRLSGKASFKYLEEGNFTIISDEDDEKS